MSLRSLLTGPNPAAVDPADRRFAEGSEEDRKQARAEWYRARFVADVMRSNLPEIPRASLAPVRHHWLEDTTTGEFYVPRRDNLVDLTFTNAVAYFCDPSGAPVLLEKPHGVKNRAELEAKQAEREQRRNAPKPRRPWADQAPRR